MSHSHSNGSAPRDGIERTRSMSNHAAEHDGNEARDDDALERFAKRAFAEDVERLDAHTRGRLAFARAQALERRSPRSSPIARSASALRMGPRWAVAGAAAVLVLAVAVTIRWNDVRIGGTANSPLVAGAERGTSPGERGSANVRSGDDELVDTAEALASPADLALLAGGEPDVLDVLEEDLAFYAWLEQQPELATIGEGRGR